MLAFSQKRWKLWKPTLEIKNCSEYSVWLEESMNRNHSGRLMTNQNCCVRWFYTRFPTSGIEGNFCTFPPARFPHSHGPYTCSPTPHRRLSLKSTAKCWKSFYSVFLKSPCVNGRVMCFCSQVHHSCSAQIFRFLVVFKCRRKQGEIWWIPSFRCFKAEGLSD